jgi:hypothetical protein
MAAGELIVPLPSEAEIGPAMKALNEQQRAFVVAFAGASVPVDP